MVQSAIATLSDKYHTSTSTRAHKNNYFNIVCAKVFTDSSSDSDSPELPHPKRKYEGKLQIKSKSNQSPYNKLHFIA